MPLRLSPTLRRISTAIMSLGNQMVYHDLEEQFEVTSSATAFPETLRLHFSAAVVDRGLSILYSSTSRFRSTIIPAYVDLRASPFLQGIETVSIVYPRKKQIVIVAESDVMENLAFLKNGYMADATVFSIPSTPDLKVALYRLLLSFVQLSVASHQTA